MVENWFERIKTHALIYGIIIIIIGVKGGIPSSSHIALNHIYNDGEKQIRNNIDNNDLCSPLEHTLDIANIGVKISDNDNNKTDVVFLDFMVGCFLQIYNNIT